MANKFLLIVALLVAGCSEQVEDVSAFPSLSPAIGQCIESIHPLVIFPASQGERSHFLIIKPPGSESLSPRKDGEHFPAGTRFLVTDFEIVKAFDGNFFFVQGILSSEEAPKKKIGLFPLIDFEWISNSVALIDSGKLPALPPTRKVPLDREVAKDCTE
jgi:hypothetical protein